MTTTNAVEAEAVLSVSETDEVTEHLAARLTGWDLADGKFSRTAASLGADGSTTIELIKIGFGVPDRTFRTTIPPLRIVDVTPTAGPGEVLTGETALDTPAPAVETTPEPATPVGPVATAAFTPAVGTP